LGGRSREADDVTAYEAADPAEQRARLDAQYAAGAHSPTRRRIWEEVFGADYPADAEPNSFVTLAELRRLAAAVRVGPAHTLVDLGCGRGGPGLWVARATGAALLGIDLSGVAVAQAAARAAACGLAGRARFQVGDFVATGLPDEAADGALSVDALLFVPDKLAAAREVARLLRAGARFAFTTWDSALPRLTGIAAPQVPDHRPLLEAAGFVVEAYEETPGWEARQRAVYERMRAARAALVAELGAVVAARRLVEAEHRPAELPHLRRVLIVARRAAA
jgi:SAM-dependent methyltransferase